MPTPVFANETRVVQKALLNALLALVDQRDVAEWEEYWHKLYDHYCIVKTILLLGCARGL